MADLVQRFTQNKVGKDWLVGDIHGFYEELMLALKSNNFNFEKDRLFAVGDLVDKGSEHEKVVELIKENWFISVRGNHDQFIIDQYDSERILFGGEWKSDARYMRAYTKGNYWFKALGEYVKAYLANTLNTLPYVIELESHGLKMGICHAGVPMKYDDWNEFILELPSRDTKELTLREREPSKKVGWHRVIEGIDMTVHGHTTFDKPIYSTFSCFIDTFGKTGQFSLIAVADLADKVKQNKDCQNACLKEHNSKKYGVGSYG
jgi:predicted phosphodiesterase